MTKMKPSDKLRAWKQESAKGRVIGCLMMLHLHDFMSDGERDKVAARIEKWIKRDQPAEQKGGERG